MKKHYLLMAAFASAMAFTACSNDDAPVINGGDINPTVVPEGKTIEIAISNAGKGTTRTARPVTSSAADNSVNKVQLVIWGSSDGGTNWTEMSLKKPTGFDADADDAANEALFASLNNQLYLSLVNGSGTQGAAMADENEGLITYTGNDDEGIPGDVDHINKKATIRVWGLKDGMTYRITAYGYHSEGDNKLAVTEQKDASSKSKFYWKLTNDITSGAVEEVFADTYVTSAQAVEEAGPDTDNSGTIEDDEMVTNIYFVPKPNLELKRQVAGIMAYFKNVPAFSYDKVTGTPTKIEKIVVEANQTMKNFYFLNTMLGSEEVVSDFVQSQYNGVELAANDENKAEDLITFDLSKIASNYNDVQAPTTTTNPTQEERIYYTFDTMSEGVAYKPGTTNTSGALAPVAEGFTGYNDEKLSLLPNTMYGGRFLIPYDKHYDSQTLWIVFYGKKDGSSTATELERRRVTCSTEGYDDYLYDILCNNFYSIGEKIDTDGNTTEEGDKPASLSENVITLRINDAWEVIHNMGID